MNKMECYKGPIYKITQKVKDIKTGKVTKRPLKDKYGNIMLFIERDAALAKAAEEKTLNKYVYERKGKEFDTEVEDWKQTKQKKVKEKRMKFAIQWGMNYLKLTRKGESRITIDLYSNPNKATLYKTKVEAQKMLDYIRWRGAIVNEVK